MENNFPRTSQLMSKRSRGQVSLPPLSASREKGREADRILDTLVVDENLLGTENLLTPTVYKHPMSPSNLSIQFNFDDPSMEGTSESTKTSVSRSRNVSPRRSKCPTNSDTHKRVRPTVSPRLSGNSKSNIEYKKLGEGELKSKQMEKMKPVKVGRYQQLSAVKHLPSQVKKTNEKSAISVNNVSSNTQGARLNVKKSVDQRKGSVYGLHEFLSLPADKDSTFTTNKKGNKILARKRLTRPTRNVANDSAHALNKNISDDSVYNVIEFLKLPVEPSQLKTEKNEKRAKAFNTDKVSRAKRITLGKNNEIPAVVVADWTLDKSSPRETYLSKKCHSHPKAKFHSNETLGDPSSLKTRKGSTYDIKEFLNLPAHSRNTADTTKRDFIDLSSSSKRGFGVPESESQYDLQEFLKLMETHKSSESESENQIYSIKRTHNNALTDVEVYGDVGRSISLYDIYEILKDTSSLQLTPDELPNRMKDPTSLCNKVSNDKPTTSIIGLTKLLAKPPAGSEGKDMDMQKNGNLTSSSSTYNLQEFLQLPSAPETSEAK